MNPGPRGEEKPFRTCVELPNPESQSYTYEVVRWFHTREEAIKWAQDNLGADEDGKIHVVSAWEDM
jgi:hypothetical protein